MKLGTSEYVIRETFLSLRRNNWMTVASIGAVTVSLFIFGMFLIIIFNMDKIVSSIELQVQVSVYLQDGLKQSDIKNIQEEIEGMQGIQDVYYISKKEALVRFKERLGDQKFLLDALGDTNPLPDSFEVTVKQTEMVKTAAESIAQLNGVEETKYGQDVVKHLFDITRILRFVGIAILLVLAASALFIIASTIRLTVYARRTEIAIMKYVGATDWFIRWPFILEGMVMGFFGALVAAVILRFAYSFLAAKVYSILAFFPLIPVFPFMNYLAVFILISGMVIGAIGSTYSIKRFLKV